jgi:small GTP-binding protein
VDYIPTVFDNYVETIVSEKYDIAMMMGLWDTFGRSDYDRLRPLSYPNTDLMVLCFDVSSRTQFESIFSKYLPEVKHHVPGATLLLLGLKSDLRNNAEVVAKLKQRQLTMVSRDEAEQLARKFNMPYMELSALDDAEGCKAALQTFATMVVERYLPKAPKVDGSGLFGFVKRMFSWATTTNKTMMANANQKQIDESSVIEAETN